MRLVVQRTLSASVTVNEKLVSSIKKGILVLAGIEENDVEDDVEWLASKLVNMRIFDDVNAVPNLNVMEAKGEIIVVSQFTLHASTKKGNRPGYSRAAKPGKAIPLYEMFIGLLEQHSGIKVQTGIFGADMKVELVNDGPLTIIMDSKNRE